LFTPSPVAADAPQHRGKRPNRYRVFASVGYLSRAAGRRFTGAAPESGSVLACASSPDALPNTTQQFRNSTPSNGTMPYLELSLRCRESEQPRYETALEDVGALSVTLLDADADTTNEHAILEPGVGQTPLWNALVLTALFPAETDALLLLAALESFDPGLDWTTTSFRTVEDQDWERAWLDQFKPMRFGARTFIVPWNHALPEGADTADAAVVRLDPGLAFGSGTHPTTALCLQWLDRLATQGKLQNLPVLDFGCGSGILALAALKLGASKAVGVDNDPQALLATTDNAERNGVAERLAVYLPEDEPVATYPIVVANILASALDVLAPTLASRVAQGGRIAISGILHGQEDELLTRYAEWFDELAATQEGDWMRIDGVRR
jgi:ribosomal protein L11 methyltransferase